MNRFIQAYKSIALIFLNTLVFLVIFNLLIALVIVVGDKLTSAKNPIAEKYKIDLKLVYPELNSGDIDELLNEIWNIPYVYEPYTLFKERQSAGKYVNISEFGFRKVGNQGPWPISNEHFNIFFFGGSTSFGYGIADNQTVPSQLQVFLNEKMQRSVRVYNFGRGFYYQSQELVLLLRLLSSGHKPDMVVFLDGLNEFFFKKDAPFLPRHIAKALESDDRDELLSSYNRLLRHARFIKQLPMVVIVEKVRKWTSGRPSAEEAATADKEAAMAVIKRYTVGKEIIQGLCGSLKITPVFVWQPTPTYKINRDFHLFPLHIPDHALSGVGYPLMRALVETRPFDPHFIWAADLQSDLRENLYVDAVHYNERMCGLLAEFIGSRILGLRP